MRKAIVISVLAVLVLATLVIWMLNSESSISFTAIAMISIQVIVLVYAALFAYKRWNAAKNKLPVEDEMSKKILQRSTAASYHVSLFMWLAMMYFEEDINLERHTLIGAGILGMAVIFGLCWVYYNYFKRSHD